MLALAAAAAAGLFAAGVLLLVFSLRRVSVDETAPPRRALRARWVGISRPVRIRLVVGVAAGILAAAISGIVILALAIPVAVVTLPMLLGKADTRERDVLSALETWARSLAAAADTGSFTLRDVVEVTRPSAPPLLRPYVDRLYTRMNGSWSNSQALRAFAEELDNPWADEVVLPLVQAAEYSAGGLSKALDALADSLKDQLELRMEIYVERDKPRRTMVTMTGIVVFVLAGVAVFARLPQLAFYSTPGGGFALALILSVFALLLIWARRSSIGKPEARLLMSEGDRR